MVGGQGLARLALIIFALTDSVMVIASGGDEASASSAVMYAAVSTALCLALWWALGGARSTEDLVRTEAIGWRNATFLSFGILVGFGVVAVLPDGDARDVAVAYVDPVLMLIIGLAILPTPIRLLRTMSRELLEMRPAADVRGPRPGRCARDLLGGGPARSGGRRRRPGDASTSRSTTSSRRARGTSRTSTCCAARSSRAWRRSGTPCGSTSTCRPIRPGRGCREPT